MTTADRSTHPTQLGGLSFYGVPFPVAIGNRYVHLRLDDGEPICQIWRWDSSLRRAVREPDPGEKTAGIRLEPVGEDGLALELSADRTTQLAGTLEAGDTRVVCTPRAVEVWRGDVEQVYLEGGSMAGMQVGIHVSDQGVAIGGSLPQGFDYRLDYVHRRVQLARLIQGADRPLLNNLRFVGCRVEGPAVVFAAGPVTVARGRWDLLGAPQAARYIRLPEPEWAYGVVMLDSVDFEDCDLVNIAVAVPEDQ